MYIYRFLFLLWCFKKKIKKKSKKKKLKEKKLKIKKKKFKKKKIKKNLRKILKIRKK